MDEAKYDSVLLDILSNCGRPERFLEIVFGFLYRRTDFYHIANSPQTTRGFPPAYANKVTYQAFEKYHKLAQNDPQRNPSLLAAAAKGIAPEVSEVVREEVVDIGGEQVTLQHRDEDIVVQADGIRAKEGTSKLAADIPNLDSSDSFNGASYENYSWTQSHDDVDVRVAITKHHRKCAVTCPGGAKLKVTAIENDKPVTLVEGDLLHKIKESEMIWTCSPGESIHISLEKVESKWWDSLLTNENKIDLKQLEVTKAFDELDEEEQMKIRQLQQESIDKLKGKMDNKKQDVEQILRKAWNAEGSPFKGSEYDPSLVNMETGSGKLTL